MFIQGLIHVGEHAAVSPPFHDKLVFFVRYNIVKKENNMKFNI